MTMELSTSLEYEIHNLTLVTKYGNFEIRDVFLELNIYDHILQPCMSGNILIQDSNSLNTKLKFDGSEYILIDFSKNDKNIRLKKSFHIFKMTDRKMQNLGNETYVLHFISDEFILSQQKVVNRSFKGKTYSEIVDIILNEDLKINNNKKNGLKEKSLKMKEIVVPRLKPLETIIWCSKRAISSDFLPNFLFYENAFGYNFVSLSQLKKKDPLFNVNFSVKNVDDSLRLEVFGVRDYEVISQYDYLDNIRSGVYSGTFIGFDPITRTVIEQKMSFDKIYGNKFLNKNSSATQSKNRENKTNLEMYDSRIVVFPAALQRNKSDYVKTNKPATLSLDETPEFFVLQRKAILQNLFAKKVKIIIPGNFNVTSGVNLNLMKPKNSSFEEDNNIDKSIYGKYLVVATRHIIKNNQHETVVELVSDSVDYGSDKVADVNIKEVLNYG